MPSVRVLRVIALVLAAANLSCDIVKPKDRPFNGQAKPPTFSTIDPSTLRPGQHLAGRVNLELNAASVQGLNLPVVVVLAVDDSLVVADGVAPYQFELDTGARAQGTHVISFQAFESDPGSGLYGYVGLPSLVLSTTVVFDQTPPTPVTLNSVAWVNNSPVLSWTRNADLNFYGYQVSRSGNWGIGGPPPLLDQATVSYRDTVPYPIYGLKLDYTVKVLNRAAEAPSNVLSVHYGERVPGLDWLTLGRPITSTTTDEFYAISKEPNFDTLKVVSTTSHVTTRVALGMRAAGFGVSADGTKILVLRVNGDEIRVYEASTLNLLSTIPVSPAVGGAYGFENHMKLGRPGRAYVPGWLGRLDIVNTDTGALAGQVPINLSNGRIAMSPDGNTLYAVRADSVFRVDVSTDVAQIIASRQTSQPIADLQVSSDGSRLYLGHFYVAPSNFVEILDASSLATVGQVSAPSGEQLYTFLVTPGYLYLSQSRQDPRDPYFQPGRVVQYDRASLGALRSWDFVQVPSRLVSSRNEQWLYALGSDAWIVSTTAPAPLLARR